jgi:hypothetical protein
MRIEDLKEFRDRHPFVPLRIVFTDGRHVHVPHGDFLMIGKHTIEVVVAGGPASGLPTETIVASPLHVVRIEMMQALA